MTPRAGLGKIRDTYSGMGNTQGKTWRDMRKMFTSSLKEFDMETAILEELKTSIKHLEKESQSKEIYTVQVCYSYL